MLLLGRGTPFKTTGKHPLRQMPVQTPNPMPPAPVQSKIPPAFGCSPILRTNSVTDPLKKLIRDAPIANGKSGFSAAADIYGTYRLPYGTISNYSVLGVGYNM